MAKKAAKTAKKTMKKTAKKKAVKKTTKKAKEDPYKEILNIMDEYYDGTPPRTRESLED